MTLSGGQVLVDDRDEIAVRARTAGRLAAYDELFAVEILAVDHDADL